MEAINLREIRRSEVVGRLGEATYDVLVIGGGITGAGIALDAASRGLKVAQVEQNDFASGTSSRSTKLIHGGLRYLKQFEIALVREVGRERATVHKLAPHLVRSEKMLLPLIRGGTYGKISTSLGLMVYDVLAGVESADQRKMLTREETLEKEPLLDESVVEGAGIYAEYRTDDARLTIEVVKAAVSFGADCANYVRVEDFIYQDDRITGVQARDRLSDQNLTIRARYVVSAAGPWVDELRKKNESLEGKRLHLTKGVHIVVPRKKLPVHQAVYFDVPDGRMIFAIPRGIVTYIGTTDTDYYGDKNHVLTNLDDVSYLLDAVNHTFPEANLTREDVVSSWAGLRPLIHEEGKSASELSRKDEIFESDTGLISIAGGKLTGYRKMAERVVNVVARKYEKESGEKDLTDVRTDIIPLGGKPFDKPSEVGTYQDEIQEKLSAFGYSDPYFAWYLVSNYGKQTDDILTLMKSLPEDEYRLMKAECLYGIRFELIQTLSDFFIRRTGRLYFDIESVSKGLTPIAEFMQEQLGWSEEHTKTEIASMKQEIREVSEFS